MFVSHVEIKRMIYKETKSITNKELFLSNEFRYYLFHFAEVLTKKYDRNINVLTCWEENSNFYANTDMKEMTINCGNPITSMMPNRGLMADSLIGLLSHEAAHILFTDFDKINFSKKSVLCGHIYPDKQKYEEYKEQYSEMKDFVTNGDQKARQAFWTCAFTLLNIIEDAYVESRMSYLYRGSVAYSLQLVNRKAMDNMSPILEQIQHKYSSFSIISNLFVQYCLSGNINNLGDYQGEYMELLLKCIPILDATIYEENQQERICGAYDLMAVLWKYINEMLEKYLSNEQKQDANSPSANNSQTQNEKQSQQSSSTNQTLEQMLMEQVCSSALPNRFGSTVVEQVVGHSNKEEMNKIKERVNRNLKETNAISAETNRKSTIGYQYESNNSGNVNSAIKNILEEMGKQKVNEILEVNLKDELQTQSNQISYGDIHKGIKIEIHRMLKVPSSYKTQYSFIAKPIEPIALRTAKLLEQVLKKQKSYGKMSGFYMGHRICTTALLQNDGRIFYKNKVPLKQDLAVAVLVDQSGSMGKDGRIDMARAASIAVYNFCQKLNVPVFIAGHNYSKAKVRIFIHGDFDSVDGEDKFRLMDIHAENYNRDGTAARYALNRLSQRPEKLKLFFILSDGLPNADDYTGEVAEADLREIKKEYTNKGILFFAAAIGDDSKAIQRIYGNSYIDMTDLKKLPQNLVRLVSKYIK